MYNRIPGRKLPSDLKNEASLNIFKHKLKNWTPQKPLIYKMLKIL